MTRDNLIVPILEGEDQGEPPALTPGAVPPSGASTPGTAPTSVTAGVPAGESEA